MKKFLVFNWKMNPYSVDEAKKIVNFVSASIKGKNKEIVIVPPFIYIQEISKYAKNKNIKVGAQNVSQYDNGAFTGEISAGMLKKSGVKYVIVGHSERRYVFGENDKDVNNKITILHKNLIVPILCVGEKSKMSFERAKKVVIRQLFANIKNLSKGKTIIAYEPVWAIGGAKRTNSEYSAKMISEIKNVLKRRASKNIKVLYGGSINCNNVNEFLKYSEIDGFLVGSASLEKSKVECLIKKCYK